MNSKLLTIIIILFPFNFLFAQKISQEFEKIYDNPKHKINIEILKGYPFDEVEWNQESYEVIPSLEETKKYLETTIDFNQVEKSKKNFLIVFFKNPILDVSYRLKLQFLSNKVLLQFYDFDFHSNNKDSLPTLTRSQELKIDVAKKLMIEKINFPECFLTDTEMNEMLSSVPLNSFVYKLIDYNLDSLKNQCCTYSVLDSNNNFVQGCGEGKELKKSDFQLFMNDISQIGALQRKDFFGCPFSSENGILVYNNQNEIIWVAEICYSTNQVCLMNLVNEEKLWYKLTPLSNFKSELLAPEYSGSSCSKRIKLEDYDFSEEQRLNYKTHKYR